MNKSLFSTGKDDWATPQKIFEELDQQYHFTLDPCASLENAKCPVFFNKDVDGLKQSWSGTVFMNPPYSRGIQDKFIHKAYKESLRGAVVVCLIPARTDTKVWHDIIFPYASEIRFIKGRIKFVGAKSGAPFPSAIVVFRGNKRGVTYHEA